MTLRPLKGKVAVVAGSTRGAGGRCQLKKEEEEASRFLRNKKNLSLRN